MFKLGCWASLVGGRRLPQQIFPSSHYILATLDFLRAHVQDLQNFCEYTGFVRVQYNKNLSLADGVVVACHPWTAKLESLCHHITTLANLDFLRVP
jgi:hypothetical protein